MHRSAWLLLLSASVAAADPPVTGRLAERGRDVDDAVAKVTRSDDSCLPHCTTTPVRELALGAGVKLAVRRTTSSGFQGKGYVIVVDNAAGTWAWNGDGTTDNIWLLDDDSGMGKTSDEQLDKLTIERRDGLVWIHFAIAFSLTRWGEHHHSTTVTNHYDTVVACRVERDAAPSCVSLIGDRWRSTKATIRGTTVTLRSTDSVERVTVQP